MFITIPLVFKGGEYFNWIVAVVGFCAFGWLAYSLCEEIDMTSSDVSLYISMGLGLTGGIVLAYAHKLSVFAIGAVAGAILFQFIHLHVAAYVNVDMEMYVYIPSIVIFSGLFGYMIWKCWKSLMGIVTSFVGGFFFASGLSYF